MSAGVLANEFAKMRNLHVVLLVCVLLVVVTGIGLFAGVMSPDFDRSTESSWNMLLMGLGSGIMLASPLLLSVIASRLVDAEHQGSGWLMSAASGVTPGGLCRAKLVALGLLVTGSVVLASALFALVGITAALPIGRWLGLTLCVLVVNLAVLALHVVLAARVENQLVGIGVGLLGTVLALFGSAVPAWVAHLSPWGYYALSSAAGYIDGELTGFSPSYLSVAGLGVAAAVLFGLFTHSFDRQEA